MIFLQMMAASGILTRRIHKQKLIEREGWILARCTRDDRVERAARWNHKDGQLVFTRKLVQNAATIPADQYVSVRSFFEKIRAAEQAPVVLARK